MVKCTLAVLVPVPMHELLSKLLSVIQIFHTEKDFYSLFRLIDGKDIIRIESLFAEKSLNLIGVGLAILKFIVDCLDSGKEVFISTKV